MRWRRHRRVHRGRLFLRFALTFGLMALLVVGGMAALARVLTRLFGGGAEVTVLTWAGGCGLSLALPLLAGFLALRVFRGVTTPMADVMEAADAVAEGNLSARVPVPEHGPDEFINLAESFNRMAQELEQADQRRRNLTADVAHELRNPLHIIQGNLEGVLDGVYEPTDEHVVATLEETRLLARLVEDLRTLSLAEAGELPLRKETVDVVELLVDVRTSFSGQVEAAGLELRVGVLGDLPTIVGDVERLEQVLNNLVANAVRHTPRGGRITLEARHADGGVRIVVSDTGEGIPPEDLPYVFDRFWRGDRARSRGGGASSGLGLAIARQLVEAHGGRIDVESEVGVGTTFVLELPRPSSGEQRGFHQGDREEG
jgi:two-component system OmpR family sensor kinase/two-component system sensor histidine kinase BaeS